MADAIIRDVIIGPVRLILGDCLKIVSTLGRVDHVVEDPPYEAATQAAKNSGSVQRVDGGSGLHGLDFAPIDAIRAEVVAQAAECCNGWFIAFCTPEGIGRWADAINASPMRYKRACHWIKPDATPQMNGQGPAQGAEHFVTAWAGRGHSRWNAGGKRGVYVFATNGKGRTGGHPTEKPVALMRALLHDFTKPGELVLDRFMGSGTTLVAAIQTGRRAIGIELNPEYFDLAERRVRKALADSYVGGVDLRPQVQESFL